MPAGKLLATVGYWHATLIALGIMALGCGTVWGGATRASYDLILLGLFVIASGTTLLQVAANPLASLVGAVEAAASRLNLAQAANSLGTVLGPLAGASLLLGGGLFAGTAQAGARDATLAAIGEQFAWIGAAFLLLALFVVLGRNAFSLPFTRDSGSSAWAALRSPAARFGAAAIFFDVGAEVAVSSILIDFLREVLSVPAGTAGRLLALYWGGLLVGRLMSGALAVRIAPALLLVAAASGAILLAATAALTGGWIAAGAALAIGLAHAMFFPTIFSLTLARSAAPAPAVSGLLCSAILGGALVPQLFGRVADRFGLHMGFPVLVLGYLVIIAFARSRADRLIGE